MTTLGSNVLGLFAGGGSNFSSSVQALDISSLAAQPQAFEAPLGPRDFARMAPWDQRAPSTALDKLAREALGSRFVVDRSLGSGPGSAVRSTNDRELFVIHNAVRKLQAIADVAANQSLSAPERARFQERVNRGMAEINKHVAATKLSGAFVIAGKRLPSHQSEPIALPRGQYDTRVLATGGIDTVPAAFEGNRRFALNVTENGATTRIEIDLADLGETPRTLSNVTGLINTKLADGGFDTRITRVESSRPADRKDAPPIIEHRLRVSVGTGESLKFEGLDTGADPALVVAGGTGAPASRQGQLSKLTGLSGSEGTVASSAALQAAQNGTVTVKAMARGPDGSMYAIADATGPVNGVVPKSGRDVMLVKYDTTGAAVWTRPLGSAATAEGMSIAVGANGTIAVAGAVNGLADRVTTTTGEGRDSFVAAFDAEGRDLFYHQQGARGSDEASHVAVGDDGSVFVLGRSGEGMGGAEGLGGNDAYLQSLGPDGAVRWTRTLGGAGVDLPAGLALRDGRPVAVWNEDGQAKLGHFDPLTGEPDAPPIDLSASGLSRVTAMAVDETGGLFVAGAGAGSAVADTIARLDPFSGAAAFTVTTGAGTVRTLTAAGGQIAYATDALGSPPATGGAAALETRVRGLSASTGAPLYDRASAVAVDAPVALALEPNRSATLDALGLPAGDLLFGDTEKLTDRTGLRAGDHFFIAVNGGAQRRIDIAKDETFRTLAAKLNRVLGRDGRAEARTLSGNASLIVTPAAGDRVELRAGPGVADALKLIGMEPGVAIPRPATSAAGTRSVSDPPPVVALDIPATVDLSDRAKAKSAAEAFDGVLRRVRLGYREISDDPTMVEVRRQQGTSSKAKAGGSTAYYQAQAAAGEDALRRLGVLA